MKPNTLTCFVALTLGAAIIASAQIVPSKEYTAYRPTPRPIRVPRAGIVGQADTELTHALAIAVSDRQKLYKGTLTDGNKGFRLEHLPVGKYDVILFGANATVAEGVSSGSTDEKKLPAPSAKNLDLRISKQEAFFNKYKTHRVGIEGERAIAFVERLRDKGDILKQSGEKLNYDLRRFEVIEMEQAKDDWQVAVARLLFREQEPIGARRHWFRHGYVPTLGNIRVVDSIKDVGKIEMPK